MIIQKHFEELGKKYSSVLCYIYATFSYLFSVLVSYIYKKQVQNFPYFQFIEIFALWTTIFNLIYLYMGKLPATWTTVKVNRLLILRGFVGSINALIMYIGIRLLPFSEGIVITNIVPTVVGIMAVFILNEPFTKPLAMCGFVSIIGVCLIAKPPFIFSVQNVYEQYPDRFAGIMMMILFVFTNSSLRIIMRAIGKEVSSATTTFYWGIMMGSLAPILEIQISGVKNAEFYHHFVGFCLAAFNLLSLNLITRAFSLGKAGNVALMSYLQIIFSYLIDIFLENLAIDNLSLIGSVLIFSCLIINVYFGRT